MAKTVLITGVNGGIGVGLCRKFRVSGWSVIGVDLKGPENEDCNLFIMSDVSDPAKVQDMFTMIRNKYSSVDCIINNAALQVAKTLLETSEKEWADSFNTNVYSIYYTTKYLMPLLMDGAIINISSIHSKLTSKGLAAYVASKGAVSALTRVMALELAENGIRVNAILPGAIDTPMLQRSLARQMNPEEARKKLIEGSPLKKIGTPEDVANLSLFLADNTLSGNITGQEFVCDAGVSTRLASE